MLNQSTESGGELVGCIGLPGSLYTAGSRAEGVGLCDNGVEGSTDVVRQLQVAAELGGRA
jgi:hypothetical protein